MERLEVAPLSRRLSFFRQRALWARRTGETSLPLGLGASRRGQGQLRGLVAHPINVIFRRLANRSKGEAPADHKADRQTDD